MTDPILGITDGTTTVNLISQSAGIFLDDWTPSIAPLKGGGTYQQSVMSDGKQLVMTNYDNAIETFTLKIREESQDSAITMSQELLRLLEKARSYWTTKFQTDPVWLIARSPNETNTRYAIIHNYQQSGLDNPYAQPFFSCGDATMDDITLVIERGHWLATEPGDPECVQISSYSDAVIRTIETVGATSDDCYVRNKTSGMYTASGFLRVGAYGVSDPTETFDLGVRFSSVDIDDDAVISQVFLRLIFYYGSIMFCDEGEVEFRLYGEDANNAATFSTYANFTGRVRTSEYIQFFPKTQYVAGEELILDITDLFNAIRDKPGWTDGNAMVFFIEHYNVPPCNYCKLEFSSYDDATYDDPQLLIDYQSISGVTTPSCDDKFYVTDKFNTAALSHIYTDDGGVWSANLIDSTAINIFPAVPAVNDAIYFGCGSPFSNVAFYIDVGQEDLTVQWEYYQDTVGWSTVPGTDRKDATKYFTETGYVTFTFPPPYDSANGHWVTYNISGAGGPSVSAYWIRARVTAVGGSPVRPETANQKIYTVTWPNINISEDEVGGDIEALATLLLGSGYGIRGSGKLQRMRLIASLQSERGPYAGTTYAFNAYLPYSDTQLPSLIDSIGGVSGDASYYSNVTAPSGRCIELNPTAASQTFDIYHTVDSSHFFGKYRVFLRAHRYGATDTWTVKVELKHDSTVYAETNEIATALLARTTTDPKWQFLDLGELSIPTGLPARMAEENVQIDINLHVEYSGSPTYDELYLCDLILMPSDEWIIDIQDFGTQSWAADKTLYIDSALVPKSDIRGLIRFVASSYKNPVPMKTIGRKLVLPSNKAAKIWIASAKLESGNWISHPGILTNVQLYKSEQYLGLRGNR